MIFWIAYNILAGATAYFLGSIPTGYWLGRMFQGIDVREHGSKSTGATNVFRTLGKGPALVTLSVDVLKGVSAVIFVQWLYAQPAVANIAPVAIDYDICLSWAMVSAALLAILGHSKSVFLGFTGGKSAATGLGVLMAMSWEVGLGVALCFLGVLAVSRIVSLSSMSAAIAATVLMYMLDQPTAFVIMALVGAAYVVYLHRANFRRLLAGTEPRLGAQDIR